MQRIITDYREDNEQTCEHQHENSTIQNLLHTSTVSNIDTNTKRENKTGYSRKQVSATHFMKLCKS